VIEQGTAVDAESSSRAIVLHEDKRYYEEAERVSECSVLLLMMYVRCTGHKQRQWCKMRTR
jgi:hypothetical protein